MKLLLGYYMVGSLICFSEEKVIFCLLQFLLLWTHYSEPQPESQNVASQIFRLILLSVQLKERTLGGHEQPAPFVDKDAREIRSKGFHLQTKGKSCFFARVLSCSFCHSIQASKSERNKAVPTYKDLDFLEIHPDGIMLEADTYAALIKTIQRDCRVLESFKIMDYSLLVGVHNLDIAAKEDAERRRTNSTGDEESGDENAAVASTSAGAGASAQPPHLVRSRSINRQKLVAHSTALESIQAESEPIDEEDDVP